MTHFECQSRDVSILHRLGKRDGVRFYEWVDRNRGYVDENYTLEHVPNLSICNYDEILTTAPPLWLVGQNAGQRMLFGDEWADNVTDLRKTPDLELEKNAKKGYEEALNGPPVIEEIQTIIHGINGLELHTYVRVLSVLETKAGFKFFAFYGSPIERVLQ